jgi:hypothetical protein
MPLYLAYGGEWLDLACGILGVWAMGPKLHFQWYNHIALVHEYSLEGHTILFMVVAFGQ